MTAYMLAMVATAALQFGGFTLGLRMRDTAIAHALVDVGTALGFLLQLAVVLVEDFPFYWAPCIAGVAGYYVWSAWRNWRRRNRKDRKPSRVLGVVKNLGHRLTVVPVPGGAQ